MSVGSAGEPAVGGGAGAPGAGGGGARGAGARPAAALDGDVRRQLLTLGVATVYEASRLPCALDSGLRPAWPGARLCGTAFTVRCHPGDNLALHRALAEAAPGDVLVVDAGGHLAGYWGEVMTVAAQARGVEGMVIHGGLRDTEGLQRHGFAAFCRGVSVLRTVKHEPGELQVPLVVGGVAIAPGDVVLGDGDGLLALPRARCEDVLAAAAEREAKERVIMDRLRAGELTLDIYGFRVPPG